MQLPPTTPIIDTRQNSNEADTLRKSQFLNTLIIALLALQGLTLLLSIVEGRSALGLVIQVVALGLSGLVYRLNHRGHLTSAAYVFCTYLNLALLVVFVINVLQQAAVMALVAVFLISLVILISGILINGRAALILSFGNATLVFVIYAAFAQAQLLNPAGLYTDSLPVVAYLILVGIISWLYERTLKNAYHRLEDVEREQRMLLINHRIQQRDLEIAQSVQARFFPPVPDLGPQIDIATHLEAARETSGDFYDFIQLDDHYWGIVVADVSGKSIGAALIMTMCRSILRSQIREGHSPAEVLRQTNLTMLQDAAVDQIVTIFYGLLNTETLTLSYANAGHPYPILKRKGRISYLELPGLPIKAFDQAEYRERTIQLHPGDQLFFFSDGAYEAFDYSREMFGFHRLEQTIAEKNGSAADSLAHIKTRIDQYRGPVEADDDVTLLVLQINAQPDQTQEDMEDT